MRWLDDFIAKKPVTKKKPTGTQLLPPGRHDLGEFSLVVFCIRPPELLLGDKVVGSIIDGQVSFSEPRALEQIQVFVEAWEEWLVFRR